MITNFKEIRRDGDVIDESMPPEEVFRLSGGVDKIAAVTWNVENQLVERRAAHSVLAEVLPDRSGVAWLENLDETAQRNRLSILNADGSLRFEIPNTQVVNGKPETGQYAWFEPAKASSATYLGIVFCLDRNQNLCQVDIDTSSGVVAGVYPAR